MKKLICALLLFCLAVGVSACSSGVSQEEYDQLKAELEALKSQTSQSDNLSGSQPDSSSKESDSAWKPGDPKELNSQISQSAFNADDVISKLETTEYTWKSSSYYYVALVVKNGSSSDINISVNMTFYDNADKIIGAGVKSEEAIAAGAETVLVFSNDTAFVKYTYVFDPSENEYYSCVSQNIEYEESLTGEKAIITATNSGELPVEFAKCVVIFISGNSPVGYDEKYCVDSDNELKPTKSQSIELSCYEAFDSVKVFFTGTGEK